MLPGLVYFIVSRYQPALVALAATALIPVGHLACRLVRGKPPTFMGLVVIAAAGLSAGLAVALHSPMIILAKGAVWSGIMGLAFAGSAAIGRPLTRTLAIRLVSEHPEERRRLSERWGHPGVLSVFRTLSVGWGVLLLLSGAQQGALAMTVSPGIVMAVSGPVRASLTAAGIGLSILYVRRLQRADPELGLLPQRVG